MKRGQLLLEFDMDFIRSKGLTTATPVVVTNHDELGEMESVYGRKNHGDTIIRFSRG